MFLWKGSLINLPQYYLANKIGRHPIFHFLVDKLQQPKIVFQYWFQQVDDKFACH
jgi:hypothetical protein